MSKASPTAVVSDLLDQCALSEARYARAAELAPSPELGFLFHDLSRQRASFGQELRSQLGRLAGAPQADHPHPDLYTHVGDYDAALSSCVSQEVKIEASYSNALSAGMESDIQAILYRHQAYVLAALDRLHDLNLSTAA